MSAAAESMPMRTLGQAGEVFRQASISSETRAKLGLALGVLRRSSDPDAWIASGAIEDVCSGWDRGADTEIRL